MFKFEMKKSQKKGDSPLHNVDGHNVLARIPFNNSILKNILKIKKKNKKIKLSSFYKSIKGKNNILKININGKYLFNHFCKYKASIKGNKNYEYKELFASYYYEYQEIPKCFICDSPLKIKFGLSRGFGKYCSIKCQHLDNEMYIKRTIKIKETNMERYGVESVTQVEEFKQKAIKTNLKKYGVKNPAQSKQVKQKAIETNIKKYGVETALLNDKIKEKTKKTNIERYGYEHHMK